MLGGCESATRCDCCRKDSVIPDLPPEAQKEPNQTNRDADSPAHRVIWGHLHDAEANSRRDCDADVKAPGHKQVTKL
nr:putative integron gene cassette protein [uncultured bacterium]